MREARDMMMIMNLFFGYVMQLTSKSLDVSKQYGHNSALVRGNFQEALEVTTCFAQVSGDLLGYKVWYG